MESPCPPQLSSLPSEPATSVGPSTPSQSSGAPSSSQPTSIAGIPAASAEPRRQHRKRALPPDVTSEVSPDLGVDADPANLESPRAGTTQGHVSGTRSTRRSEGRRVAGRAHGGFDDWTTSMAVAGRRVLAPVQGPNATIRPQGKRRRMDEGIDGVSAADEVTAPLAAPAASTVETGRPGLMKRPLRYVSLPIRSCVDASVAPLRPSPYLGVFPTPLATIPLLKASPTQPPTPSLRLSPVSARIPQGAFPTLSTTSQTVTDAAPRTRRRANSLPIPSSSAIHSSTSRTAHRPLSSSSSRAASPVGDGRHPLPRVRNPQRRSAARAACDRSANAHPPLVTVDELLAMHAARVQPTGRHSARGTLAAVSLTPPVTRATLRELDLQEIMRNPQLRHDVVFDPNLMFRPNYDGERGERKRAQAAQYWTAVAREIDCGCRCTTFRNTSCLPCICLTEQTTSLGSSLLATRLPSRIALLIAELRNIFVSLLPAPTSPTLPTGAFASPPSSPNLPSYVASSTLPSSVISSRDHLLSILDPDRLMDQLDRGCVDVPSLARFLGATVKQHCAPMRDDLVDAMVDACEGEGLAKGLQMCFEILELMKLDIANHQLRSLRPYLVQTALDFERRVYQDFAGRRRGPHAFDRIRSWLHSSMVGVQTERREKDGLPCEVGMDALVEHSVTHGLLDLVFPTPMPHSSASAALPETLQLDSYRIQAFHSDAVDLAVVYVLTLLFGQLAYPAHPSAADVEALRQEIWCIMASSVRCPSSLAGPAAAIQGIPQGPPGEGVAKLENKAWRAGMQDVLLQIARRATELRTRHSDAAPASSPTIPDPEMLALVTSYFDTNVRSSSKLFQLLQYRLRDTVRTVVEEELGRDKAHGPMSYVGWWTPQAESMPMATGGVRRSAAFADLAASSVVSSRGVRPSPGMMASAHTTRWTERSQSADSADNCRRVTVSPSASVGHESSLVDLALQRNGLAALSGEVRLLGMRIARVIAFNIAVYRPLYSTWLSLPPPPNSDA